ncbi:copper resistance system multicopper oxidase [Marinobacterium mangrovicola]|uniref:CopA family copper-resistance protein n=1 Tax=Marinobacterium mangrovicola TaxID=1476959 RepID=A0A4R1G9L0_9GAMM|nr:copper resistance system multicopper oxidase [Marinobacterium mangrovicola]TCK02339.1 CopA family copper-resistance protein [Marinobacterium mangrovicola]
MRLGHAVRGLLAVAALAPLSTLAGTYDLVIDQQALSIDGTAKSAMTINGGIPGPTLRFKEGEEVTLNVTNQLDVDTSLHWHGLLVPYTEDGVPGISFDGIKPGETHTYHFPIKQSGTYWYHSHSGFQEQEGVYGPIIIEPAKAEPFTFDREYVVMLSDWSAESGDQIFANLKGQSDYYNYHQQTAGSFIQEAREQGFGTALKERLSWGGMRMMPTDIADVSGYSFLVNGKSAGDNWTGLFTSGERVRLRFINGSAMSYFDIRIPGLKMTVVQADGNNVQPVSVDEFRMAVAETYDVIVEPKEERAYSILAESVDRAGFARGTLAPRDGMAGDIPELRERPLLTMADMSMASMEGMDHSNMTDMDHSNMADMAKPAMAATSQASMANMNQPAMEGMNHSAMNGMNQSPMNAAKQPSSDYAPGSGLTPSAANGGKFLVYGDLKAVTPYADYRAPDREIELRLTGNMERYFWSINGTKYSDAEPIKMTYGERVRIKFVNDTMMNHPMHLHGMWMQLDKGKGEFNPLKHVVNVAPNTTLTVDVPADALGEWAFHCHLMYHMASGMFRKVIVETPADQTAAL